MSLVMGAGGFYVLFNTGRGGDIRHDDVVLQAEGDGLYLARIVHHSTDEFTELCVEE